MRSTPQRQAGAVPLGRARDTISRWVTRASDRLEGRTGLFLALLFVCYLWILKSGRVKLLWHDELYTFYIAQAPSLHTMGAWIRTIDLNPPLYYLAARLCFHVLHPSAFAVRLPSMIGYFTAAVCLYVFVRRRLTPLFGLLGALVLLSSSFNQYAYEARPYALVLGCLGVLAIGWQRAIEPGRPRRWAALLLVLLGGTGMLLSHILASVAYAALLLTEAIRCCLRRRVDGPLWAALALPLAACATYFGPIQNHSSGAFPQFFQASFMELEGAYSEIWVGLAGLLGAAMILMILLNDRSADQADERTVEGRQQGFAQPEILLALGLCCVPLVVLLVFMHSHSAYFPRYGMPAIFGVAILTPALIARWTRASSRAALIGCVVFFFGIVTPSSIARHLQSLRPAPQTTPELTGELAVPFADVDPGLPLVDSSGLTFLEMNSREPASLLHRVYYLTDMQAAVEYANATIFEGLPFLKDKFPIQANIQPYREFIARHSTFLVLGTYKYPEDWLLRRLLADHARLEFLGDFHTGYKDEQLYKVTLAAPTEHR